MAKPSTKKSAKGKGKAKTKDTKAKGKKPTTKKKDEKPHVIDVPHKKKSWMREREF